MRSACASVWQNTDYIVRITGGDKYDKQPTPKKDKSNDDSDSSLEQEERKVPIIDRDGCRVEVIHKTVSIYDTNGKLLRHENIIDYTKTNLLGEFASLEKFIEYWNADEKKEKLTALLHDRGIDLESIKQDQNMSDTDDFDFVCHLAFDKKPLTRRERAEIVKQSDFLKQYPNEARAVLEALLDKYMNYGITQIENMGILKIDPINQYGTPSRIVNYFGGKAGYMEAVKELERVMYSII